MKKIIMIVLVMVGTTVTGIEKASAQAGYLEIIKAGVKKAIKAFDLKVQRLQNETIWLQNAQKTLENTMSKLKLDEISGWAEKQTTLFQGYYQELAQVKMIITYYQRIKDISAKQVQLVGEYSRAWSLLKKDKNFSEAELSYMADVYSGIIDESVKNLDQIFLVVNSFQTTMSDAKRLEIINSAADEIDDNYDALTKFNTQNFMLTLQRTKSLDDYQTLKKIYGLN